MPKFPADQDAARRLSDRHRREREERERKHQAAVEHDEAIIRDFANQLRAKAGEPPLAPGEKIEVIRCNRGRR